MKHRYMLNIGLDESVIIGNGVRIPASRAMRAVRRAARALFNFTSRIRYAVHDSATEPTIIVEIATETPDFGRVRLLADVLCSQLKQEAIAVAKLDANGNVEQGVLRGPMSSRWGTFNPEYFILLHGKRASA